MEAREYSYPGSAEEPGLLKRPGQGCVEPARGIEDPKLPLSAPNGVQLAATSAKLVEGVFYEVGLPVIGLLRSSEKPITSPFAILDKSGLVWGEVRRSAFPEVRGGRSNTPNRRSLRRDLLALATDRNSGRITIHDGAYT